MIEFICNKQSIHPSKEGNIFVLQMKDNFSICLHNNSINQQVAVISVNGLSVIDGSWTHPLHSVGFIVNPKTNLKIKRNHQGIRLNTAFVQDVMIAIFDSSHWNNNAGKLINTASSYPFDRNVKNMLEYRNYIIREN